jgi:hypothetical protein
MKNASHFDFRTLALAASLALGATGVAHADDSSMSMYTGDSYAYFNNQDYTLGKFNVARAPAERPSVLVQSPAQAPRDNAKQPILIATRPATGSRTNPFRDDTGA